jgi:transcriptional regulator with XRE-family HTH domain
MTPFGAKIRALRTERRISQREMASALGVSAAYLSALEHGRRGAPGWAFVQKVIGYFNVIWDDAEELQRLAAISDPRVMVDTSGLSDKATEVANILADRIRNMKPEDIDAMLRLLRAIADRREDSH